MHGAERLYEKEEEKGEKIDVIDSVSFFDAVKSDGFKRGAVIVVMLQVIGQATGTNAIFLYRGFGPKNRLEKKFEKNKQYL